MNYCVLNSQSRDYVFTRILLESKCRVYIAMEFIYYNTKYGTLR
jgi:hypothetical protein